VCPFLGARKKVEDEQVVKVFGRKTASNWRGGFFMGRKLMWHPTGLGGLPIGTLVDSVRENSHISGHRKYCSVGCGKIPNVIPSKIKCLFQWEESRPSSNTWLGPLGSTSKTASRSYQPFLHGSRARPTPQTHRWT